MRYLKLLIITIFLQSNYAGVFLSKIQEVSSLIENQGSLLLRKFSNQSTLVKSCLFTSSVLNILASSYLFYHYKTCVKREDDKIEEECCMLECFERDRYLPFNFFSSIRISLCALRNMIFKIENHILCSRRENTLKKLYSLNDVWCDYDKLKILFDIKIVLDIYLFLHVMIIIVRPLSLRHE
jgi:hypothetical protein